MRQIVILICLLCSACGLIQDRSTEYSQAKSAPAVKVPDGLSDLKINPSYPVPLIENNAQVAGKYILPKPPSTAASQESEPYSVEEVEGKRWLNLQIAPGRAWPLIEFFLAENNILVASKNIVKGTVTTSVLESGSNLREIINNVLPNKGAVELEEKYLKGLKLNFELSQGVKRKTSEVSVGVLTSESLDSTVLGNVERVILDAVGQFISSEEAQNRQSLLAHDISGEPKVFLISEEDESYLKFDLSYERTWLEVGKALESSGAVVSDINRSKASYYVSYIDKSDLDSWFVSESKKNERLKEINFEVKIVENGDAKNKHFLVFVKDLRKKVQESSEKELLELIYEHVS